MVIKALTGQHFLLSAWLAWSSQPLSFAVRCHASADYVIMRRLCVCHVRQFCQNVKTFHYRVTKPFWFFPTKWHDNITTGIPLTRSSNAGGVGRNRDTEPISGFTACCQCCDHLGVINTVPPDHAKL